MRGRVVLGTIVAAVAAGSAAAVTLPGGSRSARHATVNQAATLPAKRHRPARTRHVAATRTGHVDATLTLPNRESRCQNAPPPVPEHPITHRRWLSGVTITEYYPAPERWFVGRRIAVPGAPGRYAADWLYSARGVAMEGDGVDRHGRHLHIAQLGSTGWVNANGRLTVPVCLGKWSNGFPVWLIGGWRNRQGQVTFPLQAGGWSNGRGVRRPGYGGVTFALGSSQPLRYYHSIAVDPRLIPLGSRVYVPAYRQLGGGWFVASDTGGAIRGRHIDVYRPAPANPDDLGRYMTGKRILVIPPG